MKTLVNEKVTLSSDGKTVNITAEIKDIPFSGLLVTRVTHQHINPENIHHGRAIQSSNEAVFLKTRNGSVAFPNDFMANIAMAVEPLTSFPPKLKKSSKPGALEVVSELPVTYQWQISDNAFPEGVHPPPVAIWTDIPSATSATLDESTIAIGKWIRCVITNGAGTFTTNPAKKDK